VPMRCDRLHVEVSAEMRCRVDQLLGPGHLRLVPSRNNGGNGRNHRR